MTSPGRFDWVSVTFRSVLNAVLVVAVVLVNLRLRWHRSIALLPFVFDYRSLEEAQLQVLLVSWQHFSGFVVVVSTSSPLHPLADFRHLVTTSPFSGVRGHLPRGQGAWVAGVCVSIGARQVASSCTCCTQRRVTRRNLIGLKGLQYNLQLSTRDRML